MIRWFKKLFQIVRFYDIDLNENIRKYELLKREHDELVSIIKERTSIGVDVGYKGGSYVILMGHYRGRDYIQSHRVNSDDFIGLIQQLKQMEKYGEVCYVDEIPNVLSVRDAMEKL